MKQKVWIVLAFIFLFIPTAVVKADFNSQKDPSDMGLEIDKWKGTASKEVETAIAAGKSLYGKTLYKYGAGHNDSNVEADEPPFLDCSGFTAWVYKKGPGIIFNNLGPVYTTYTVMGSSKYWVTDMSKVKRGDLVICYDGGHVVVCLGKEGNDIYQIGANGSDGAGSVSTGKIWGPCQGFFDVEAAIRDKAFSKYDKVKPGISAEGSSSSFSNESKDGESEDVGGRLVNGGKVLTDKFIVNGYGSKTKKDWDEADVSQNLPDATFVSTLSKAQLANLQNWTTEYKNTMTDTVITVVRTGVQIIAILFIFLAIAIIFAYLFDRVGILDFSMLYLLTGGRLYTVYETDSDTFFSKGSKQTASKGVSMRTIAILFLILLTLAILIFTGQLYYYSYKIVNLVQRLANFLGKHMI